MRKIHPFWAALSALIAVGTLALCFIGTRYGVLFVRTSSDPRDAVTGFFDAMKAGDPEKAYAMLENYDSLGLENSLSAEDGQLLFEALLSSYDYSLIGDCSLKGITAEQRVRLTALDLNKVDERRVQDPSGEKPLLPVAAVLEEGEDLTSSSEYTVTLRYSEGQWRIVLDDALRIALAGGR